MMRIINNAALIFILFSNPAVCQNKQGKVDMCDKKVALANLENIQKNAKAIITASNDDCVLGLLDTLTSLFINTQQTKYIQTLDAVCKVNDGYVSEHFLDLIEKLTFESFNSFVDYMALQQADNCLEKNLLEIMKWKLKDGTSPRKEKLIKLIDKELKATTIKAEKKKYLAELRKKVIE